MLFTQNVPNLVYVRKISIFFRMAELSCTRPCLDTIGRLQLSSCLLAIVCGKLAVLAIQRLK